MAIAANTGSASSTAKISDVNALVTAINTELALYATKASVDALTARVTALEAKVIPPDLTVRVKALEDKPAPVIPPDLTARVKALEIEPDPVLPPDLTVRVSALEGIVASFRTPPEVPTILEQILNPATFHQPRNPAEGVELIYDKATLYYGDMELHAVRIGENTWRLLAQLNYITVNQILWTYDETVHGTPAEIYAHASARLEELAALKVDHDRAHKRVREMSEGRA